jgi:hypothetical protein
MPGCGGEPEQLLGLLDVDGHFVVVVGAGDRHPVHPGADFGPQDLVAGCHDAVTDVDIGPVGRHGVTVGVSTRRPPGIWSRARARHR